jgi:DHA3 family macrolide efflux protein-like MFS transporter
MLENTQDCNTNWKKNVALFLSGQTASMFGSMIVQYAIMWHIMLKTNSGSMLTVYVLAAMLPMFVISFFGGVWADKYNKKHIINIADGIIAITSLVIALAMGVGYDATLLLLIAAAIRAFAQGVQSPAVNSLIPFIVPQEKLMRVNGIFQSINSIIMLFSPMAAAALMTFAPLQTIFYIDVVTAAISIVILYFFVKVPKREITDENENTNVQQASHFRDIVDGFKYIKKNPFLVQFFIVSLFFLLLGTPMFTLTPLQVIRNWGGEAWQLSAIESIFGVGMILGGVLMSSWGGLKNRIYTMALAILCFGIGAIFLGIVGNFWIYVIVMGLIGFAAPISNVPMMTVLQEKVSPDFMGRVMSVLTMLNSVAMPVGILFFGPMCDVISVNTLVLFSGITTCLITIPMFISKTLKEAGKPLIDAAQ